MKLKSSKPKAPPTRQAVSIALIRADRAAKNLCCECGAAPRERRKIVSTGKVKLLSRCAGCLAAHAAREAARK